MADGGGEEAGVTEDTVIPDAEADVLIAEAVQRRDEQKSGRSMARRLPLVSGCAVAGLLLLFVGWRGYGVAVAAFVAGALLLAVTGLLLLRALDLSPATQWGEPVGAPCPACAEHSLREGRVAVPEANGIVVLCTQDCGYAEVRPDPESSAESPPSVPNQKKLSRTDPADSPPPPARCSTVDLALGSSPTVKP